jgi:RNA polymerase sigma factor (sigma-70 family)
MPCRQGIIVGTDDKDTPPKVKLWDYVEKNLAQIQLYAYRIIGIRGWKKLNPDDLVSEILFKILQRERHGPPLEFESEDQCRGYLFGIIRNTYFSLLRRESRHFLPLELDPADPADPALIEETYRPLYWLEDAEFLSKVMGFLGQEDRRLLEYRFVEGMTFQEISGITGLYEQTIRKRVSRLIYQLRELLKDEATDRRH